MRKKLSITAPVYNEEKTILQFMEEVARAVSPLREEFDVEILLVNDGSTDGTGQMIDELAAKGLYGLTIVHLARNFGHPVACIACMEYADGDGVVLMDSDGQDDPNAIPQFVEKWREGYDVVYATRSSRQEGSIKRGVFRLFYRLLCFASNVRIPLDSGNYSLMDKRVVNHIKNMAEGNRYLPGLRAWLGYRQVAVPVARRERDNGGSRVGFRGLLRLASNAFFSFSYLPIRIFDVMGIFSLAAAVGVFLFALYYRLFTEAAIPAWTSQIIITSFFGGINLLGIGIIGEYVARIYDQVKGRPKYTVDRVLKNNNP